MKKLLHSSSILFLEEFLIKIFNFLAIAIATRILLPDEFGAVVTGTAFLTNLSLICDLGTRTVALIETAKPEEIRRFTPSQLFSVRIIPHVAVFFFLNMALLFLPIETSLHQTLAIFSIGLIGEGIYTEWYFRGKKHYLPSALARSSASLFFMILILVMSQNLNSSKVALAFIIPHTGFALALLLKSKIRFSLPSFNNFKHVLQVTLPVGGGKILQQVPLHIPPLLITGMVSAHQTAFYGTAFKVISLMMIFDRILNTLFLAELPKQWHDNKEGTKRRIAFLNEALLTLGALAVIVLTFLGDDILALLFGEKYRDAGQLLQIFSIFFFFTLLNSIISHSIIALKNSNLYFKVSAMAAVVTLPLLPLFILQWGAIGAAIAISLAEGSIFFFSAYAMRDTLSTPLKKIIFFLIISTLCILPILPQYNTHFTIILMIFAISNAVVVLHRSQKQKKEIA